MQLTLVKAHNELDKAVDAAYIKQTFTNEAKQMKFCLNCMRNILQGCLLRGRRGRSKT